MTNRCAVVALAAAHIPAASSRRDALRVDAWQYQQLLVATISLLSSMLLYTTRPQRSKQLQPSPKLLLLGSFRLSDVIRSLNSCVCLICPDSSNGAARSDAYQLANCRKVNPPSGDLRKSFQRQSVGKLNTMDTMLSDHGLLLTARLQCRFHSPSLRQAAALGRNI